MIRATRLALILGLAGLLLGGAAPAHAARGLQLGITDELFEDPDAGTRDFWLGQTANANADSVLVAASWAGIAPSSPPAGFDPRNPADPAYTWTQLDAAVRDASAHGLGVAVLVTNAPTWAQGADRPSNATGSWKPDPGAVGDFGHAIATRYSGSFSDSSGPLPRVRFFQLWAEPNLAVYLTPQWEGGQPVGAQHYRLMLNAFYDQVHAVNPGNMVITGGTAPYGEPPGGQRTRPVAFWRAVLCLNQGKAKKVRGKGKRPGRLRSTSCPVVPKLDILAHNPINTTGRPLQPAFNPDDASSADLDRIVRVLRAAERAGTVSPRGKHPVWATEMWWESNPPTPAGSPLGVQARRIEQEIFLLWKDGASAVFNERIRDAGAGIPGLGSFAGLFLANGQPKPALTAFRFPFVGERRSDRTVRVWGKAPASGALAIQVRRGKRWRTLKTLKVGRGAVFLKTLKLRGKHQLRARIGGESSLPWFQR